MPLQTGPNEALLLTPTVPDPGQPVALNLLAGEVFSVKIDDVEDTRFSYTVPAGKTATIILNATGRLTDI